MSHRWVAGLGFTAAVLCWVPAGSFAQQPSRVTSVFGDWTVNCALRADKMDCDLEQMQQPAGQSGPASAIQITLAPDGRTAKMGIQVPPDLWIPDGVRLVLQGKRANSNEKPEDVTVLAVPRWCLATRCLAEADVTADQMKSWQGVETGRIEFKQANQHNASIVVSMKGFAAAWKQANKQAAK